MLKHPNIVAFIGYAASETELVLVMEFIEGTNLHQLIFGEQKVITRVRQLMIIIMIMLLKWLPCVKQASINQRMHIVKQIAYGIQFMHTRKPCIVHQDIKPLNVMVCS